MKAKYIENCFKELLEKQRWVGSGIDNLHCCQPLGIDACVLQHLLNLACTSLYRKVRGRVGVVGQSSVEYAFTCQGSLVKVSNEAMVRDLRLHASSGCASKKATTSTAFSSVTKPPNKV